MSSRYPIPGEALDDRLGWTGTSGTGKTYDSGTAIERVLKAKSRAAIVDPLGVWWGLRLGADGKSKGFDVAIFGGPHGDIAITETSGKLIGETVASTKESCIVDLSEFDTDASQRRFMLAFLVALYNGLKGDLLHLVLDEADMWAPQSIKDKEGGAATLHHNVQKIVRRGRVKGFIPWLITQRPAEISKSILSMMDGMVMHQATSPQDIDACMDWVKPRADKATAEMIETRLPAFERGEAVVYIPRRRVLNIAQFPTKVTFDSSRSPERGEKKNRPDIALKPLDLAALKKRLEKVEAEAKANDPNALKTQIAELQRQLRSRPAETKTVTVKDEAAIARAEERGFERGKKEVAAAADRQIKEARVATLSALGERVGPLMAYLGDELKAVKADRSKIAAAVAFTPSPVLAERVPRAVPSTPPRTPSRDKPVILDGGDGTLTNPQLTLLRALAWWKAMGHDEPRRPQVAAIARWKPTGSNLRDRISELNKRGLIENRGETVRLTPGGEAAAPAPDMAATMVEGIRSVLTGPQLKLFDAMNEHGNAPVERAALAEQLGWEAGGSNLRDRLSELKRMDVVVYSSRTEVQLADWLFATGETLGRAA